MNKSIFVENVKRYCEIKGVKPTVACRESGVGTSFINNIEVRGQVPSVEKVQILAEYLGVTTSELLGEKQDGPRAVSDAEAALDQRFASLIRGLSPSELDVIYAFIQNLLSLREQPPSQKRDQ